ncbi:MAG: peptidoglycan-binding protein LysM [bacterium]|nr:peptidoglycan-binding protein LysM [bacterium]
MGFFDFVKDVGKKVEVNYDLATEVKKMGLEVENLAVKFEEGVATVSGSVKSQADREKVILALGNIGGVSKVEDSLEVLQAEAEAVAPAEFYTVKPGDTLGKVAKEYYGNAMKYMDIFEANKPMLSDPNKIYVGQVLRIPKK